MSHFGQRLEDDKAEIRNRVVAVGEKVREAVLASVESLLQRDRPLANRIMLGDLPVNREIRSIDKACHEFVALHLPSAGHLRFVSTVLQMNVAIERIGDYAVTIAREAVQLQIDPPENIAKDIGGLAKECCGVLARAIQAFRDQDVELARTTKPLAKRIERTYGRIFEDLTQEGGRLAVGDSFAFLTVFHRLERVSDQAKNICEETIFELTGETKPPKQYNVLFVDARDTLIAPLAVALARKAFPESGSYHSAGYRAGESLAPELLSLAAELSLDLADLVPTPLSSVSGELANYHVIICLDAGAVRQIEAVPYATVLLQWELPRLADALGADLGAGLRKVADHLVLQIRELMITMRGEEAH